MKSLTYWLPREVEAVVLYAEIQPYRNRDPGYTLTFYPGLIKTRMALYTALTAHELGIVFWAAMGLTNKEIAELLTISPSTVETYFHKIFIKMGVDDRTAAVVWAIINGLITIRIHDCLDT